MNHIIRKHRSIHRMKIRQLLTVLCAGVALSAPAADELTRVIGYNVLIGFNRAERIEETASWLREKKPDVVLFQEIARQTDESFARQAKLWNHSYAAVCKPWQDYSIGMTSKRPFEMLEMRIDGLHHGYILARIDGVYYMSIHLSPFRYAVRIRETEIYTKRLKPLLASFPPEAALEFFERLGVSARLRNGYAYPRSEQAASLRDALVDLNDMPGIEEIKEDHHSY